MTREKILEQVRDVLAAEVGSRGDFHLETDLVSDLRLDSLGLLILTVALENRFAVCLDAQPDATLTRVGDVVDSIATALAEQEPAAGEGVGRGPGDAGAARR